MNNLPVRVSAPHRAISVIGATVSHRRNGVRSCNVAVGAERRAGKSSCWGVAAEYLYGGSLDTNLQSTLPVALGGRGDLVGSFDTATLFLAAYSNWKF